MKYIFLSHFREKRIEDDVPEYIDEDESKSLEPVRPVIREVVSPLHPTEQYLNKSGLKGSYDPTANDEIPTEVLDTPSKSPVKKEDSSIHSYSNNISTARETKIDNNSNNNSSRYNDRNNNPNRTAMMNKEYYDDYPNDRPIAGSPHVHINPNKDIRDDRDSYSPGPDGDNEDDEYYPDGGYRYSDGEEEEYDYTPPGDADYVRPSGGDGGDGGEDKYDSEPIIFADTESKKCFLTKPCPVKYGVVQCYIERTKQGFRGNSCQYDVYLRDGKYL